VSTDGPGGHRDEALVAYVEGIEAGLRTRRGADHVLSPPDFALARSWHAAGVPLATVLVAIDLAFDAGPQAPSSLAALRRRVEELAAVGPRPPAAPGPARETERVSLPEVQERLQALRERLLELPGRFAARPLSEVGDVADLVAVASRPNWDYLRGRLRRIDESVAAAAVEALDDDEARAVRAEAERATARHRGRVADAALDEARERLVRQRAREKLRLPRVSVD
jgi:hypothetical protein